MEWITLVFVLLLASICSVNHTNSIALYNFISHCYSLTMFLLAEAVNSCTARYSASNYLSQMSLVLIRLCSKLRDPSPHKRAKSLLPPYSVFHCKVWFCILCTRHIFCYPSFILLYIIFPSAKYLTTISFGWIISIFK